MGRTIHRTPLTVSTNPGIKYEFFNHANWNGLCDDKNYLNVNQETFEDCNNVYVDENNLLKSRPSLKFATDITDTSVVNIWKFDDITCWLVDDVDISLIITDGSNTEGHYIYSLNTKLFKYGDKIFVLDENHIWYIDDDLELVNADDYLYAPIRYTYANGVRSEDVVETDNLLTTKYRERYIYNNIPKITNPTYRDMTVTVDADGEKNTYIFTQGKEDLIFFKQFEVSDENYIDNSTNSVLLLDIADDNTSMILSKKIVSSDVDGDYITFQIQHSVDGKTFKSISSPVGKIHGRPIISRDGTFVVVFKDDGPYALSLIADTHSGVSIFPYWTNLLTYNSLTEDDLAVNIGTMYGELNNNTVNGYFLNSTTFGFVYNDGTFVNSLHIVFVNDSNVIVNDNYLGTKLTDYTSLTKIIVTEKPHFIVLAYDELSASKTNLIVYDLYEGGEFSNSMGEVSASSFFTPEGCDAILVSDGILKVVTIDGIYNAKIGSSLELIRDFWNVPSANSYKFVYGDNIITSSNYILFPNYDLLYIDNNIKGNLIVVNDVIWFINKDNVVYNNYIGRNFVTVEVNYDGEQSPFVFDHETELGEKYWSKNDTLYISSIRFDDDDNKLLYFPKINNQKFDKSITNLHPISETQVAIFFDDQIWYSQLTEQGYAYYKSKLQVGLDEGADVITSPDGTNIIFPTERGLVYLGYQELVQSSEQTLTFLSDTIQTHWKDFVSRPVKLLLYKYWIYCYNENERVLYIFDIRNNSWWKWTFPDGVIKIAKVNIPVFIVDKFGGILTKLDDSFSNYFDYDDGLIDWHFTSQKLHLGTLNYYKNIMSIIINNVEHEDVKEDVSYNLDVKNYRISSSYRYVEPQNFSYKVDMLRTFVKRCNSRKVNEFQYTLSSDTGDNGNVIQLPLSIHSIIIKYTVSGQVR